MNALGEVLFRVLSEKELNYLKDHLSWELLAVKKFHHYADQMQDPGLKQLAHELGQKHQNRYQTLLNHVHRAANQASAQNGTW